MQNLIELEVEGQQVVLSPGATMSFEWNNPVFAEEVVPGSFSLPFDLPAAPNGLVFGFPELVANTADVRKEYNCVLRSEGEEIRGLLKLRKVTPDKYTVNIQIGYSAFGELLKSKSLRSFGYQGQVRMGETVKDVINHMMHTVKHPDDYDYIFAPVHNPAFYGDNNAYANSLVVNKYSMSYGYQLNEPDRSNPWFDLDGAPVYACFVYQSNFGGGAFPGFSDAYISGICPFPKLRYILNHVARELGARLDENFFDEELSKLFILTNGEVSTWALDPQTGRRVYQFELNKFVPDITFSSLLTALKGPFGLSVQMDLNKNISVRKVNDIINGTDYLELTPFTSPGHEIPVDDVAPITLTYKLDDALASERVKDFADKNLRFKDPVQTVADLPNYLVAEDKEIRLVLSLDQYYCFRFNSEPLGWSFYSDNYLPLKVQGGGSDQQEQGISLTLDFNYSDGTTAEVIRIPAFSAPSCGVSGSADNALTSLRLAFYRGLQPSKGGAAGRLYPMLSGDNYNAKGEPVGNYSLKLDGDAGTYNQFLSSWLDMKVKPRVVQRQLYLNMMQLKAIDFNKKVNIDGNRFLIRKLKFTLPITKPVSAELVQVKK